MKRLLIVDDSEDTAESTALLFAAWNYEVRVAHSGPAALQMAASYQPDAVLLDIGLPGMDGCEVARRLRRELGFKHTVLIAVSGYGLASDRQRSFDAGFDEHLVKPVNVELLRELLGDKLNPLS